MTWGDVDGYIRGMEEALRLSLEATSRDFYRWEEEIGPPLKARGYDEFSLPEASLQAMPTEEKLAYGGRLLRSLGTASRPERHPLATNSGRRVTPATMAGALPVGSFITPDLPERDENHLEEGKRCATMTLSRLYSLWSDDRRV
jgi:hypothetical protein